MAKIKFGNKTVNLPRNRMARIGLGLLFLCGGVLWFLPVLGIWMIPIGFLILAADSASIRRFNRRILILALGWWNGRKSARERRAARAAGNGQPG